MKKLDVYLNRFTKYKIGQKVYLTFMDKEILEMTIKGFYIYEDRIWYYEWEKGAFFSQDKLYPSREKAQEYIDSKAKENNNAK